MTIPSISRLLDYARVQMAAEALYDFDARKDPNLIPGDKYAGAISLDQLTEGNGHPSRFTPTDAEAFASEWEVVEHISNTGSGFSGTLLRRVKVDPITGVGTVGDYVLSIRSTEFIDDAVRDCEATNTLEIKAKGWAFGQIADMENWYQTSLKTKIGSAKLDVTGYSLGGHLATAFNLMHKADLNGGEVVTFNGAGVGLINGGNVGAQGTPGQQTTLSAMITEFQQYRDNAGDCTRSLFTTAKGRALYDEIKLALEAKRGTLTGELMAADFSPLLAKCDVYDPATTPAAEIKERTLLADALLRIRAIVAENDRVRALPSGGSDLLNANPAKIYDGQISATGLDYQLAVLKTSGDYHTASVNTNPNWDGLQMILGNRVDLKSLASNQTDIVGTETTSTPTSMVSNSQVHYGELLKLFIEDQPDFRGNAAWDSVKESVLNGGVKLLVPNYSQNDFGDTHSLVLLVDSLAVMKTLALLDTNTDSAKLGELFKAASSLKEKTNSGANDQGECEGDVLENVLNSLCKIVLGSGAPAELKGKMEGNTWADPDDRKVFYEHLAALQTSQNFKDVAGKVTITLSTADLATTARTDFSSLLSLITLSPFVMKAVSGQESAVDEILQSAWQTEHAAWAADKALTPEQLAAGATYTDQYLKDRAALLSWVVLGNTQNVPTVGGLMTLQDSLNGATDLWRFTDLASGKKINHAPAGASVEHTVVFGADEGESISGGFDADRLYGGGGDDSLTGGAGNDLLQGGAGTDTYAFTSGDGWDTITDSDGLGKISIDGILLTGGTEKVAGSGVWFSADKKFQYALFTESDGSQTLNIVNLASPDDRLFVRNYRADNNLGILLHNGPTVIPAPTAVYSLLDEAGRSLFQSIGPAASTTDLKVENAATAINCGSAADPVWRSTLLVNTGSGADLIEGGAAGAVSNVLYSAGAGNDRLYAGVTTPLAAAIARGDAATTVALNSSHYLLDGGAGDDQLIGSDACDVLFGGADDDTLVGGAGGDIIIADGNPGGLLGDPAEPASGLAGSLHGNNDYLDGGEGNDKLTGNGADDSLKGRLSKAPESCVRRPARLSPRASIPMRLPKPMPPGITIHTACGGVLHGSLRVCVSNDLAWRIAA